MPPTTLSHQLLSTIYPLKEADRQRDPNTQLSVLALGLSRSGTDSLRQALIQLGYSECYHGFVCGSRYPDLKAWCRLYAYKAELARQRGLVPPTDPNDMSWWHFDSGLTREDFEPMLADCRAVTDLPCCMFIYELIRCYPEAKVLVNFREDVDAWHKSIETNCKIPFTQNREWKYMSLCSAEFFWWYRAWRLSFGTYWDISNWDARGKAFHNEHYAHLRRVAKEYGRETLEWRVQDGWKPLCEFLGHQAPDRPFPSGNTTPEFQAFAKRRTKVRTRKSIRNILILLGLIAGGSMAWIWRSRLSEIISKMRHLLKEQTYLARR